MNASDSIEADKRAVEALVRRIFDAYLTFDPDQVDQCDMPDCTVWDLFEPELVRGGPAARAEFRKKDMSDSQKRGKLHIQIDDPIVIDVWDDTAVARYYLDYEFEPPGALAGRVRITTVARRVDGQWRRVHHHEGVVPTGRPSLEAS